MRASRRVHNPPSAPLPIPRRRLRHFGHFVPPQTCHAKRWAGRSLLKRFGCVQLEWKEKAISLFRFLFDFFCFFFSPPASSSLARCCWAGPSFLLYGCFSALLLPRLITAEVININRGRRPACLRTVGGTSQQKSTRCHGMLRLDCLAFSYNARLTLCCPLSFLSYIVLYYSRQTSAAGNSYPYIAGFLPGAGKLIQHAFRV